MSHTVEHPKPGGAPFDRLGPNFHLIAQPNSRAQLSTPCLIVDRALITANIAHAADLCGRFQVSLRPHAKTHKCSTIAKMQIDRGAAGICVATVGEAERLFAAGISDMHITSAFSQPGKISRVVDLVEAGCELSVVVDSMETTYRLGAALQGSHGTLGVLIDIDMGRRRSGIVEASRALELAQIISAVRGLRFSGIQAYAGHLSHIVSFEERATGCRDSYKTINDIRALLERHGYRVLRVTGGSTGSLLIDAASGVFTELQCGSYVFNDAEYMVVDLDGTGFCYFEPSLFVRTTVISSNWPGEVVTDAGHKHFVGKSALPQIMNPGLAGAVYRPISDEHGRIELAGQVNYLPVGVAVECIVPHCDPTVNCFDAFHVVADERLTDIWPIEARGAL